MTRYAIRHCWPWLLGAGVSFALAAVWNDPGWAVTGAACTTLAVGVGCWSAGRLYERRISLQRTRLFVMHARHAAALLGRGDSPNGGA